jgi:hypothetical protein
VAVEKGTNVVISRKFSLYGERVFNNLQTDFSAKTGPKEFFNSHAWLHQQSGQSPKPTAKFSLVKWQR